MKLFITAFAITSTLLLAQGCTSKVKFGEIPISASPVAEKNPHEGHSMGDSKMPGMEGMETSSDSKTATAKLIFPTNITAKNSVPLVINVQDNKRKAITKFDTFQEKLMHVIVVSDDLQLFNHIHPTYKENGRFETNISFLQPGNYTIFSDYKPSGQQEQVSVLKTQVPGKSSLPQPINLNLTKTFADTKANLTFSQPMLKARQEVTLMFDLKQTDNNQPITDLQPYLGEKGHLVIVKQSLPLTEADYIHAHALQATPPGKVYFMTSFPQPGRYKLWGQFNRNGKIIIADFWVNVQ